MGQQQLILLVLATVIVGVAIVVGIRAFTENSARSNADALMQDAVRMASDAQALIKKPDPFGGVDGFASISDVGVLGYASDGGVYTNLNGTFEITTTAASGIVITALGGETGPDPDDADVTVGEQVVTVAVCGLTDTDIDGSIVRVGGETTGASAASCS